MCENALHVSSHALVMYLAVQISPDRIAQEIVCYLVRQTIKCKCLTKSNLNLIYLNQRQDSVFSKAYISPMHTYVAGCSRQPATGTQLEKLTHRLQSAQNHNIAPEFSGNQRKCTPRSFVGSKPHNKINRT